MTVKGGRGVKRSEGRWRIGERADGSAIELPYIRWDGGSGPHLYLGITIHGDELTGQASLWRVGAWLDQGTMQGTVTAVPVQNPEGFNYNVRGVPGTTWDLNRSYPGDPKGGTAERITARLTAAAREADAAIDVHTAGWCMPYILLDPVADAGLAARTLDLARATGVTIVREFVSERYEQEGLANSLPPAVLAAGRPSFTLELGGYGNIEWSQVEAGAAALRNAIRHLGIIHEEPEAVQNVPVHHAEGHHRHTIYCEHGGLIEFTVRPGDELPEGRRLGRIRDVYGRVIEEIVTTEPCLVLALHAGGTVWSGGYVAEVAVHDA